MDPFLVRSSSWQGPFYLSNLSRQKGAHFSHVPVPGSGLFFSATYLGKKGIISRTFQFLAGAFFSQQLVRAQRLEAVRLVQVLVLLRRHVVLLKKPTGHAGIVIQYIGKNVGLEIMPKIGPT